MLLEQIRIPRQRQWLDLAGGDQFLRWQGPFQNGSLQTDKQNREGHGMGLSIIREIVEYKGGVASFEPDPASKTFVLRMLVPQLPAELVESPDEDGVSA